MYLNQIRQNYKIRNTIVLFFISFLLIVVSVNLYLSYKQTNKLFYNQIDTQLQNVVIATNELLGKDFFERATSPEAISSKEDRKNILKLSKLAHQLGVTYLYSLVAKDNKVYFTSSSATDEELKNNDITVYYDEYNEASKALKDMFRTKKRVVEETTDKWGTFRSVLVPFTLKDGTVYVVGADLDVSKIKSMLHKNLSDALVWNGLFFFVVLLIGAYFYRLSKKDKDAIEQLNQDLQDVINAKTKELQKLNESLEQKVAHQIDNLRKKDKQLIEQARFAQMGEMIGMIAHQWRQPLAAISSASLVIQLKLQSNNFKTAELIDTAQKISDSTQHLSRTIDDFRDFFKPAKGKKKVKFDEIIKQVLKIIEPTINVKGIALDLELKANVEINTYVYELEQVILNLIKNAQDAIMEKSQETGYIKIKTSDENGVVICEIADNGGGIPQEIKEKVFDPYFSTKDEKNGTGLGLYMSKIIIEEHCGGKISFKNTQDGVVFHMELKRDVVIAK